ncbi:sensor histidine kinase [Aureitalea marina]|uniref:Histidine kinase n=1 Tax=Aureitalea marina TaxID=930804 RepID=A0A2S7KSX6_9FLAO|nr:histidine kinase [Aureitalea marina]PQB05717.1 histidine kinase [Aureitalea marina]
MSKAKEARIRYLGFDDLWFSVIGILILSFITDLIFNNSFGRYPFSDAIRYWSMSLFFATVDWLTIRKILIYLRKRYPSLKDNLKRNLYVFLCIVLTVNLVDLLGGLFIEDVFGINYGWGNRYKVVIPVIIVSTMTIAIYEGIYLFIKLKNAIREEEQAKQIAVRAQLDTLRNQAQPHFLFNSLNTLRDIIDQDPKEDAKKFVDTLAEVYRYILESGSTNTIQLADEITFAKAYLHIQQERFESNLKLQWDVREEALRSYVIPMSLQLLLENALKHNVISKAKPLSIHISTDNDALKVCNNYQPRSTQVASTQLGLKNIEKRYALITDRKLSIQQNDHQFCVELPLLERQLENTSYATTDH